MRRQAIKWSWRSVRKQNKNISAGPVTYSH